MNGTGPIVRGAVFTALTTLAMHIAAQPAPTPRARPFNMIFVLVDDLRYDALGFLQPGLQTPNIDFLAKHGVHFSNAVVTTSLCSPSRATILTGLSTRNHKVIDNNNSSERGLTYFPQYLQQTGYQTAFFGKWHMGSASDAPRPGFDRWVSFKGQGTYFPTDNLSAAQIAAGQRQMLNVDGTRVPQRGYITDELTDYAMDWLESGRDASKPFFLYLSHKAVHSDAVPPARFANQYSDLVINLPASLANTKENNRGKPMWVLNQRNSWHGADYPANTDKPLREIVRDVYRTLSPVDESLGRILKYLKKSGLDKQTMIVFYSDNGYLIGEHGLIDKRAAYEPSIRVPLLVYAPGVVPEGTTNPARVRNLDLAPTLLEVAGVAKPGQMEGESFLSLATGKSSAQEWNSRDFLYEYYWEWSAPMTPTTFAIRHGALKYIQYQGVWDIEELYDVEKDPHEMRNLIGDPAYLTTKIDLRRRLYEQLARGDGTHVVPFTERFSEGQVKRVAPGRKAAEFPAEWEVPPNLPNRLNGFFPDSPAKLRAEQEGAAYRPTSP